MKRLVLATLALVIGGVTSILHIKTKTTSKRTCRQCGYITDTHRDNCPECDKPYPVKKEDES